jgi:hypothetical protein
VCFGLKSVEVVDRLRQSYSDIIRPQVQNTYNHKPATITICVLIAHTQPGEFRRLKSAATSPHLMDEGTKKTLQKLPLLTVNAGPRDGDAWIQRLKEEFTALIAVNIKIIGNEL